MLYVKRVLEPVLLEYLDSFPVVGITGPRQSGKSTFIKEMLGANYRYISLDENNILEFFQDDPVKFMEVYHDKVIFDEAQLAPDLFRAIKVIVDNNREQYGKFVITGSRQFNLLKQIFESLAGRIGLLSLLPYQAKEMPQNLIKQAPFNHITLGICFRGLIHYMFITTVL
ncbi:MAG: AAA family ATPase [Francisellaceae bacterium]|nr:AAA family ATPase [Francisellaceae bacterium]